jgi:hypothetical protein
MPDLTVATVTIGARGYIQRVREELELLPESQ